MRAIRIHQTGGPEVMRLEEVELPPPGKGEVRLRQHAIGVNFIDIYHRTGFYPPPLPFTPGSRGRGRGRRGRAGGRRTSSPATGSPMPASAGAYAEERNIEARFLVKLPRAISYETARRR